VKFVPVIVTVAPLAAEVGVKEDIVGAGVVVPPSSFLQEVVVTATVATNPHANKSILFLNFFIVCQF
jgi:hypothetical protein